MQGVAPVASVPRVKQSSTPAIKQSASVINKSEKDEVQAKTDPIQNDVKNEAEIKEKVAVVPSGTVTIQTLKNSWKQILSAAKEKNHHLTAFLSKAEIKGLEGDMILLDVPFSFHKKSLEQIRTQNKFSEVTKAILGVELKLKCEVNKDMGESESNDMNSDLVESVFIE